MKLEDAEFLNEAIDRFESGLEIDASHFPSYFGIAKCSAQKISLFDLAGKERSKYKNLTINCKDNEEKGLKLIEDPEQRAEELLSFAQFLQSTAIRCTSAANYCLNNLAVEKFDELSQDQKAPKYEVLMGKGLCLMSSGIEKFEDSKKKQSRTRLEQASQLMEKASEIIREEKDQTLVAKYLANQGECLVHLGNCQKEKDSEATYNKAIGLLKQADSLVKPSAVPQALLDFVKEYEESSNDNDDENNEEDDEDEEEGDDDDENDN